MIINPIIPVWLMTIICLTLIIFIIYDKRLKDIIYSSPNKRKIIKKTKLFKQYIISTILKVCIVALVFTINLRFMIPNGESTVLNSSLNVLFVVDTTISMRALDYDGDKERMEGVINDACHIVDELSGCKFSIITFGDTAKRIVPFTNDSDMIQAEIKALSTVNDYSALGSSLNIVIDTIEKTLKDEKQRQSKDSKFVIFFISDGEITREEEDLKSFSSIKQYVNNGAVLGYGTTTGGKMVYILYENEPNNEDYYISYYDDNFEKVTGLSKIDENNLKQVAQDIGIDYVHMDRTSNLNNKLKEIKQQSFESKTTEEKVTSYQDIYYYLVAPLTILLIINFIIQKRKMQ